jgi:hypothetical protein
VVGLKPFKILFENCGLKIKGYSTVLQQTPVEALPVVGLTAKNAHDYWDV